MNVLRREPLNVLPPDFVIVLITPPTNLPYSAERLDVIVVVSWMASSMNSGSGPLLTFSVMLTPFIV